LAVFDAFAPLTCVDFGGGIVTTLKGELAVVPVRPVMGR
jgi:hypothetical protein